MAATRRAQRQRRRVVVGGAGLIVAALVAAGLVIALRGGGPPLPRRQAAAFLTAWSRGDTAQMRRQLDAPPNDLENLVTSLPDSAPGTSIRFVLRDVVSQGDGARAQYRAVVKLAGFGDFGWKGDFDFGSHVRTRVQSRCDF